MYAKFFGLNQDPFSIAPDPRFLFMSEQHREGLAHLLYGLDGGGGFVLLTGEIGTGKTTVCRCFLEQIPANCNVAYIFNPKLSVSELLRSICGEFHIALPKEAVTNKDFTDLLNDFLLRIHAAGQNNVLIIDEAQNLSADVLEQLRLLTNLETNERKLLQIVLIGQPELRKMLAQPELEQLAQRIIARFHLDAFSVKETLAYIKHRLTVAGWTSPLPFNDQALTRIHQLAHGIPRRVNLLCGRSLLGAYATGKVLIDQHMVNKAASEVFDLRTQQEKKALNGQQTQRHWPASTIAAASFAGLLAGTGLFAGVAWTMQAGEFLPFKNPLAKAVPAAAITPTSAFVGVLEKSALLNADFSNSSEKPTWGEKSSENSSSSSSAFQTAPSNVVLSQADLSRYLSVHSRTQNQTWQALGQLWATELDSTDACQSAWLHQVYCFNSWQTTLSLIRALNRPGMVTLVDDKAHTTYALLTELTEQSATLRMGEQTYTVPLGVLAAVWRGEFSTLWRAPPGLFQQSRSGTARPSIEWLTEQLNKFSSATEASSAGASGIKPVQTTPLATRIYAFQLAHGLAPDGQAGPLTMMQINRAMGVDEPTLQPKKLESKQSKS